MSSSTKWRLSKGLIILLFTVWPFLTLGDEHEYKLLDDLLNGYDPLERPVENSSHPVVVKLGISLQAIVDMDEKNQIFITNVWLTFEWMDYKLSWDPKKYGGVEDVRFPYGKIWSPDVLLYNSADTNFDATYHSNLVVYSDGSVTWIPPGILRSSCKINIRWFPFDDQSCYLKFGSWTYHGQSLDLQARNPNGSDLHEYLPNGEWNILSAPVVRNEKFYDCCPEPYPSLLFYMNIRRRTLFYGFNLIIPSLLMSLMTILGFHLPPDSCEKITLEITILLSVCFFLGIVAEMSPPTSENLPLIGTFFTCCMVLVSASVLFAVFVLNLHFRVGETHEITPFVRNILLNWLPWLLMMKRPGHKLDRNGFYLSFGCCGPCDKSQELLEKNIRYLEEEHRKNMNVTVNQPTGNNNSPEKLKNFRVVDDKKLLEGRLREDMLEMEEHKRKTVDLEARITKCLEPYLTNPRSDPGVRGMLMNLQMTHKELQFITKRMEMEDTEEDIEADWKFAAMVVDRLCLYLFTLSLVVSTCGIMFSAPHLIA